jgi:hypothetical protein
MLINHHHRSLDMSKQKKAAQGSAAAAKELKFKDMGASGKIVHIAKTCLFFLTLGFAFPNIFTD